MTWNIGCPAGTRSPPTFLARYHGLGNRQAQAYSASNHLPLAQCDLRRPDLAPSPLRVRAAEPSFLVNASS